MTQPESRTVEHLSAAEILARVRFEREHRMKWEDVRGGTGEHLAASYLADAHADIAAAKEHGLVIGEGELDAAWKEAEVALPEYWFIRSLIRTRDEWEVVASEGNWIRVGRGNTPAAALHALAERLRR